MDLYLRASWNPILLRSCLSSGANGFVTVISKKFSKAFSGFEDAKITSILGGSFISNSCFSIGALCSRWLWDVNMALSLVAMSVASWLKFLSDISLEFSCSMMLCRLNKGHAMIVGTSFIIAFALAASCNSSL